MTWPAVERTQRSPTRDCEQELPKKRTEGATISAPGSSTTTACSLRDQNEYVAVTFGNAVGPNALLNVFVTGLFQKFGASVASNWSEPAFTPAPML